MEKEVVNVVKELYSNLYCCFQCRHSVRYELQVTRRVSAMNCWNYIMFFAAFAYVWMHVRVCVCVCVLVWRCIHSQATEKPLMQFHTESS